MSGLRHMLRSGRSRGRGGVGGGGITILPGSFLGLLLAGCGGVPAPTSHTYRLVPPSAEQIAASLATPPGSAFVRQQTVLRVGALELAGDLTGDRLLVAEGPVRVSGYHYHRWAGPLDRLVADAVVTGLQRTGRFAHVKAETDRGDEDLLLGGRVLDFHQSYEDDAWCGLVTLDLHLTDPRGEVVFSDEFRVATPMVGEDPEALVLALSASVGEIVEMVGVRCAASGVGR